MHQTIQIKTRINQSKQKPTTLNQILDSKGTISLCFFQKCSATTLSRPRTASSRCPTSRVPTSTDPGPLTTATRASSCGVSERNSGGPFMKLERLCTELGGRGRVPCLQPTKESICIKFVYLRCIQCQLHT